MNSPKLAAVCSWQLSLINDSTNLVIVGQEVSYEYRYQAMNTLISVVHIVSENKDSTCIYTGGCHGDSPHLQDWTPQTGVYVHSVMCFDVYHS